MASSRRKARYSEGNHGSQLPELQLTSSNPTLDYPFLQDTTTIELIRKSKVMFILRGLPGSGKSTLARILHSLYANPASEFVETATCTDPVAVICSADDHFVKNGVYKYDTSELGAAHSACQANAERACKAGRIVIVDNSNVRIWEMKTYLQLARTHSYVTIVVVPKTSWRNDVSQLALKTKHSVSSEFISMKISKWEEAVPSYFGWFLNECDSVEVCSVAQSFFELSLAIPVFKRAMTGGWNQYSTCSLGNPSKVFHCTSCFSKDPAVLQLFGQKDHVRKAYGKASNLHVIGFVITPRTIGARVLLQPNQFGLWKRDEDDYSRNAGKASGKAVEAACSAGDSLAESFSSGLHVSTKSAKSRNLVHKPDAGEATCHWIEWNVTEEQFFNPSAEVGKTAHITLGCVAGCASSQTSNDHFDVVAIEKLRRDLPYHDIGSDAVLRDFGEGRWVIYLKKHLVVQTLFTANYRLY